MSRAGKKWGRFIEQKANEKNKKEVLPKAIKKERRVYQKKTLFLANTKTCDCFSELVIMLYKLIILSFMFVFVTSLSVNDSSELVSTYAKVARWGAVSSTSIPNEGRSNGQSLWTHRSDVNIRRGQNLKPKQPVTYYYSMQIPSSKVDQVKLEPMPAKGEVQERFNPRPYFDFVFDDPPRSNKRPDPPNSNNPPDQSKPPSVVYGTPVDSIPGLSPPSSFNSKPPSNTYDSPFSSYNPPNIKPDDSKNNPPDTFNYPPTGNQPSYTNPKDNQLPKDTYGAPNDNQPPPPPPPPSSSYGAPIDSSGPSDSYGAPPADFYNTPDNNKPTDMKDNNQQSNGFHPPLAPPAPPEDSPPPKQPADSYSSVPSDNGGNSDNSYYKPPQNNGNGDHSYPDNFYQSPNSDTNNNGGQSQDNGPPITQTIQPPESAEPPYFDHPPTSHHHHHSSQVPSMAEDDLSPPPAGVPYGKIPQYLDHEPNEHDFYHFGHHDIYHEVHHTTPTTTTTTTEAPRAGHYSYYYLGRKLWYIPLYFSVYFIVYVTVLILKSIARHKIQFSHHFDKGRSSRGLDIDSVNQTVVDALESIEHKYMYEQGLEDYDEMQARQGKGMMMDEDMNAMHDMKEMEMQKDMEEEKAVANDAWAGYYDFIINEGSFKFWAVFQ
ncbi:hypothetical protein ILUMI_21596, partial [Ignelater luminosus]